MDAVLNIKSSSSLCFNKDEFTVKDFSVDKFVSDCRKYTSLDTMLEDLGLYHKILCAAMIELLNKDYADFLNLSSNLVGLDKSIKSLSLPLHNLKIEIESVKNSLDQVLESIESKFSERATTHKLKNIIQHVMNVFDGLEKIESLYSLSLEEKASLPHDVLERITLDFNLVQFHVVKVANLKVLDHKLKEVEKVGHKIDQCLRSVFVNSLTSNDVKSLQKVLRIYSVLNKENDVENCFREAVVKPFMRKTITEASFIKEGMAKKYKDILDFIPSYCYMVLQITQAAKRQSEVIFGYDFLVNAVWPEIAASFEYVAPVYIYAPGDPQLFHENFSATMHFLEEFERACQVQTSVRKLRMSSSYKNFLKKWNLDVYFQIRFQEISSRFEKSLLSECMQPHDMPINKKKLHTNASAPYMLDSSSSLLECVHLCWDNRIFLLPLSGSFLKLTLQLISRYKNWAYLSYLKCEDKNYHESQLPLQASVLIKDVETLVNELNALFQDTIQNKLGCKIYHNIEGALSAAVKLLEELKPYAVTLMVKILTKQCCVHLKLIADIPRMYRKTNREVPSKPSGYVSLVFSPITKFCSATSSILWPKLKEECLYDVTEGIVSQCIIMVHDVLTSIKKMEDSLKILKRARDKPVGHTQSTSGTITDDDKIRHQLAIDVNCIEELVENLGLETAKVKSFKELKDLVVTAERKSHLFSLK